MDKQNSFGSDSEMVQWFGMYLSIGWVDIEKSPYHSDLFEACVIRKVFGTIPNDYDPFLSPEEVLLNLTGRAMVGLNINDVEWIQVLDPIPTDELEEMYFKLKIFACDDPEAEYQTGG